MFHKYLLIPAVLSVVGLLMTADIAHAQKGRGPAGGRGGAAVYRGAPYRGGPYYGRYYGPGIGIGIGIGGYGPLYPYAYYDPYYLPRISYYPTPTVIVDPTVAAIPATPAAPAASSTAASIRVILPDPQAKVFFDGNPTKQDGTERIFHTPSLTSSGSYRIRAVYMQNGKEIVQEAVATIRPGETTVVDFTRSSSEEVPLPK
jgi:uncharacterized protein (TIGR03000 family)